MNNRLVNFLVLQVLAITASGQPYVIDWYKVAGGGTSTGGVNNGFTLGFTYYSA